MKVKIISFILSTYLIDLQRNKKLNSVKTKNKYFFYYKILFNNFKFKSFKYHIFIIQ